MAYKHHTAIVQCLGTFYMESSMIGQAQWETGKGGRSNQNAPVIQNALL